MKYFLPIAVVFAMAIGPTPTNADTVFSFGDIGLAPGTSSSTLVDTVSGVILGIDVAFDYSDSADFSWSSDYYATIIDPSGDTIGLGDGLISGDIDYADGTPTGVDGSQNDSTAGGSYGTFFTLAQIQVIVPTFGESGTYQVFFTDGWTGGSDTETLGNATVTVQTSTIPEPSSWALMGVVTLGMITCRRRK